MTVNLKHTFVFFIIANVILWSCVYFFTNNSTKSAVKHTMQLTKKIHNDTTNVIKYVKKQLPTESHAELEMQPQPAPVAILTPYDSNAHPLMMTKSTEPSKKKEVLSQKKYIYIPQKKRVITQRMAVETVYVAQPVQQATADSFMSKYWPLLVTIFTTIPTIVIKWKEMFDKFKPRQG